MPKGCDQAERPWDLEERTALFGEAVIAFCKRVPKGAITNPLVTQLVKAGTSVGANYCEADDAVSRREFRKNTGTCKKEARESKHFIRMIVAAEPDLAEVARPLWQEAKELHLIFCAIFRKVSHHRKPDSQR
jgi:four helix bundle protein